MRIMPPGDTRPGSVVIRNSWLHHMTGAHHFPNNPEAMVPQSFMVDCDAIPSMLALYNNVGMETSYPPHGIIGATIQGRSEELLRMVRTVLFMSCNLIPEDVAVRKNRE